MNIIPRLKDVIVIVDLPFLLRNQYNKYTVLLIKLITIFITFITLGQGCMCKLFLTILTNCFETSVIFVA